MNDKTSRRRAQSAKPSEAETDHAGEPQDPHDEAAAGETFAELQAQWDETLEQLSAQARQLGAIVSRQTRRHPLAACAIAFGAGYVFARRRN